MNMTPANGKEYGYYAALWENVAAKSGAEIDPMMQWNERANSWGALLQTDSAFKRSLHNRVMTAAAYLRNHDLLGSDTTVADLGCGTGRFAVEFARTAAHVTAIDISENMLELARNHAINSGLKNITFRQCDFEAIDIDSENWRGAFDLVFTSITAAVNRITSLQKAMSMSRAYCFNSSFIRNTDELETQIAKEVFEIEPRSRPLTEGNSFYSLFNLLWLDGYFPETYYHKQTHDNMVPADEELTDYYARSILRDPLLAESSKVQIKDYLDKHSTPDGLIRQRTQRWYGWILWDVRSRDDMRRQQYDSSIDISGG